MATITGSISSDSYEDLLNQTLTLLENKARNIKKRVTKIERIKEKSVEELNADQAKALAGLDMLLEMESYFVKVTNDYRKLETSVRKQLSKAQLKQDKLRKRDDVDLVDIGMTFSRIMTNMHLLLEWVKASSTINNADVRDRLCSYFENRLNLSEEDAANLFKMTDSKVEFLSQNVVQIYYMKRNGMNETVKTLSTDFDTHFFVRLLSNEILLSVDLPIDFQQWEKEKKPATVSISPEVLEESIRSVAVPSSPSPSPSANESNFELQEKVQLPVIEPPVEIAEMSSNQPTLDSAPSFENFIRKFGGNFYFVDQEVTNRGSEEKEAMSELEKVCVSAPSNALGNSLPTKIRFIDDNDLPPPGKVAASAVAAAAPAHFDWATADDWNSDTGVVLSNKDSSDTHVSRHHSVDYGCTNADDKNGTGNGTREPHQEGKDVNDVFSTMGQSAFLNPHRGYGTSGSSRQFRQRGGSMRQGGRPMFRGGRGGGDSRFFRRQSDGYNGDNYNRRNNGHGFKPRPETSQQV